MNKGPDPKTFIGLGAIAFVASVGMCYIPYSKLSSNRAKVAQLLPQVKPFNQVQQDLQTSQAKLASDQTSLAHLEANVSSAAYVPSLLLDVDKYGHQCGIQVTGVRPQAPAPTPPVDPKKKVAAKPYDELTIDVTGTGTYEAALKFLQGLPMFPKIVEARTVTIVPVAIDPKNPNASKGKLNITIEIRAFVFKQSDTPAPTAGAAATPTTGAAQAASSPATGAAESTMNSGTASSPQTPANGAHAMPYGSQGASAPTTTSPSATTPKALSEAQSTNGVNRS